MYFKDVMVTYFSPLYTNNPRSCVSIQYRYCFQLTICRILCISISTTFFTKCGLCKDLFIIYEMLLWCFVIKDLLSCLPYTYKWFVMLNLTKKWQYLMPLLIFLNAYKLLSLSSWFRVPKNHDCVLEVHVIVG